MLEQIIPYLKDPEPAVRRGALVGLLRHCGIDGVLAGGSHLSGLLASADPSERQLAAEVLGDIGITSFYRPLLALLRDSNSSVRLAAMDAARKLRAPGAIPALLDALAVSTLRATASASLVDLGDVALPQLDKAFHEDQCPRETRLAIAQIWGRIGNHHAAALLKKHLAHPDPLLRTKILAALVHCREKTGLEIPEARDLITREAKEAAWALAAWADLESDPALAELSRALLGELDERKQRIFLLLALLHPPAVIRKARLDLETTAGEKKAHALEVLDNLLPRELKALIFPLIDTLAPRERAKQLHLLFPQPRLDRTARLRETLAHTDGHTNAWTRACALYVAGKSRDAGWSPQAVAGFSDHDPLVRETALWTLSRVDEKTFQAGTARWESDTSHGTTRLRKHLKDPPHAPHH